MAHILLVGCGGFLGSVGRYLLGLLLNRFLISNIPYSTLIINLLGSFAVGVVLSFIDLKTHPTGFYFVVTGFLGGFTTYSAFSAETISLIEKQLYLPAMAYVLFTLLGGFLFCFLGMLLSKASI